MKLATVRADGRTALAGLTDAGVLDLSSALPGAGDLDSVEGDVMEAWVERIGTLRNPVRTSN